MLLSRRSSIKFTEDQANFIGHMCYAASKLWSVCNYERYHYKELGLEQYPDWYYQKKVHKNELWYKQLPAQTAQEVCKQLDKAWKSFYALKNPGAYRHQSRHVLKKKIFLSPICRWGSFMNKVPEAYACHFPKR